MFEGEKFCGFCSFLLNHEAFPRNMALLIGNIRLQACYSESFPANNHFPLFTVNVFPLKCFAVYSNCFLTETSCGKNSTAHTVMTTILFTIRASS